MKPFISSYPLILISCALALASCAQFGGRIVQTGPGTYQITHVMYANSPVKGVRQGVIDRATAKCEKQGQTYQKIREEMGTAGALSYTLMFTCK